MSSDSEVDAGFEIVDAPEPETDIIRSLSQIVGVLLAIIATTLILIHQTIKAVSKFVSNIVQPRAAVLAERPAVAAAGVVVEAAPRPRRWRAGVRFFAVLRLAQVRLKIARAACSSSLS